MVRYADLKRKTWGGRRPRRPISVSHPSSFPFSRWGELCVLPLQPTVFLIATADKQQSRSGLEAFGETKNLKDPLRDR